MKLAGYLATLLFFFTFLDSGIAQERVHTAPSRTNPAYIGAEKVSAGSVFKNEVLGISFEMPDNWMILGKPIERAGERKAKELFEDSSDELRTRVEDAIERVTHHLFLAEPQESIPQPSSLILVSEVLEEGAPASLKWYYDSMLFTLRSSNRITVEVEEPLRSRKLGGKLCGFFALKLDTEVGVLYQKYLIFLKEGTAVSLALNYFDPAKGKVFDEVIASTKID